MPPEASPDQALPAAEPIAETMADDGIPIWEVAQRPVAPRTKSPWVVPAKSVPDASPVAVIAAPSGSPLLSALQPDPTKRKTLLDSLPATIPLAVLVRDVKTVFAGNPEGTNEPEVSEKK
jgi:hypothetical protein